MSTVSAINKLRSVGYGFACSTCKKLQRSLERGTVMHGCEAQQAQIQCGGPIVGLSFPQYEGPLTKQGMATTCFVCGVRANKILQADDGGYVGCCNEHMDLVSVREQNDSVHALTPVHAGKDPDPVGVD